MSEERRRKDHEDISEDTIRLEYVEGPWNIVIAQVQRNSRIVQHKLLFSALKSLSRPPEAGPGRAAVLSI